jgi:hypothetical protein
LRAIGVSRLSRPYANLVYLKAPFNARWNVYLAES